MSPASLATRLVNLARPRNVNLCSAAERNMEQLRDAARSASVSSAPDFRHSGESRNETTIQPWQQPLRSRVSWRITGKSLDKSQGPFTVGPVSANRA